jgi:hypothetical protein
MLGFSKKTRHNFLFFCVLAILFGSQTTVAQSRRVPQKNPPSTDKNTGSTEQTAPVEAKPAKIEVDDEEDKSPVRILSLMIVGEVQHNFAYYNSNEMDIALKECLRTLKSASKSPPLLTRGDKMNYTEAKERAKKETDTFILWLSFAAKIDGAGNMYIDFIQYAVIKPKTGKVMTRGQVTPGQTQIGNPGSVLRIPTVRRRTSSLLEMKDGARQIAGILLRGGWLD